MPGEEPEPPENGDSSGESQPAPAPPTEGIKEPPLVVGGSGAGGVGVPARSGDQGSEHKEKPEIVRPTGTVGVRRSLEPLQWVATILVYGIGVVLLILVLYTVYDWRSNAPSQGVVAIPTLTPESSATPGAMATRTAEYRDLSAAVDADYKTRSDNFSDSESKLLDATAGKIIVPLFTLLVGYLFGARSSGGGQTGS